MPQIQCNKCGKLGRRYRDGTLTVSRPRPHDDGSQCKCGHITCSSRADAEADGGRYYDFTLRRWVCYGCTS